MSLTSDSSGVHIMLTQALGEVGLGTRVDIAAANEVSREDQAEMSGVVCQTANP
jgi:hypothetical protein